VGRLVAGILHEMNTPLGALSSSTQTLERGLRRLRALVLPGAGRSDSREAEIAGTLAAAERLASVQAASGQRIREVVEGLRQFVALDRAELQVADARAGLETAVALIRPGLPPGVSVRLELPGRPIWVQCFPAKLNQVFLNLLKNAASAFEGASPEGEIVVSTRVRSGRLQLEVRDTGRGIEPERLPRLFELDFSRQGSRVKLSLGLPSSRGVVEAIGGTLRIDSELGRGTAVRIELPLGPAPFAAAEEPPPVSAPPSSAELPASSEAPAAVAISPRVAPTA